MTKEQILEKRRHLFGTQHMELFSDAIYGVMDEYAKQQSIAFDVWKRVNLYTLDYPNNRYIKLIISDGKARTEMVPVDEVYAQFIEQQNKP